MSGSITPETLKPQLDAIYRLSAEAQKRWAERSLRERCDKLLDLRETIIERSEEIVSLISCENGKPRFEALSNEVQPIIDFLTYFARKTPRILNPRSIGILNPFLLTKRSYLEYWPLGTVLVISPWNYPFLLPFADIIMGIAAGNSVILKPSEYTPRVGAKIQELCHTSGLPENLIQVVQGDGSVGPELIRRKPAKIFFTGSAATGRKILRQAAELMIPVNLELSGKDVMIVHEDADLDFATSVALWGGFSNSGQACASVEKILVHKTLRDEFVSQLKLKISRLRDANRTEGELGTITSPKQIEIYKNLLDDAKKHGAEFLCGGNFSTDGKRLQPTIIASDSPETLKIHKEECFGPLLTIESYLTDEEAIRKTNDSSYGLAASIITKDQSTARRMASRLDVGTVTINEVLYTAGIPGTPWGGLKESGLGRTHSDEALKEFVHVRHVHEPRFGIFAIKSLWWFPYTRMQYDAFASLNGLNRRGLFRKLAAVPAFLSKFLTFLIRDRRY